MVTVPGQAIPIARKGNFLRSWEGMTEMEGGQ
jgi:hypothetical protein